MSPSPAPILNYMDDGSAAHTAALQEKIDKLDCGLDSTPRTDGRFRTSLRTLSGLCSKSGLLPTRCRLSGPVNVGDDPPCYGGSANVYRGTYNGISVARKVIRLHARDQKTYMKMFCREAVLWKRLDHPNIVPFIGVEPGNYACIVSEWMDNGDVLSYLEYHPSADRVRLITDIAHGLHYMHSNGLVHGDLHSRNVLVDKVGRARLVDFLLSTTLGTDSLATPTESSSRWVSVLYKAPELLDWAMNPTRTSESDVMNPTRTSESDVYAFGMTTWEIFDGRRPFYNIDHVFVTALKVLDGSRPTRPSHAQDLGLDDFVWRTAVTWCWEADPSERPQISEVFENLVTYQAARELAPKLLNEGLSKDDCQVLDDLLSTEIGRNVFCNIADPTELLGSLNMMLDGLKDSNLPETRATDIIMVLGVYSPLPPGLNLYSRRVVERLLLHVDQRRPGSRRAMDWLTQTFTQRHLEMTLRSTMQGHTHTVYSVSLSPDGSQIASGSGDSTIRIWNADTGKEDCEPLRGHTNDVSSVAFSPDGKRLTSASHDFTVRLWDVKTGQQVGEPLEGHTREVKCVAFSPKGDRIVSGSTDKTLRLWDAQTGQAVGEPLHGHSDWVLSVAFSPDGKYIISGSDDGTIRFWDANAAKPVGDPLRGHNDAVWPVAYSPCGAHIVSGSYDTTIRIWDANTRQTVLGPLRGHKDTVRSVSFSPDGQYIVSGSDDSTIRIWNAKTGQTVAGPWEGRGGGVIWSVAFSPDGKRVVSGGSDKTVKIWNADLD